MILSKKQMIKGADQSVQSAGWSATVVQNPRRQVFLRQGPYVSGSELSEK